MSRYEWEAGSLKIPSKDFVSLKKLVRSSYNKHMDRLYDWSLKAYERILEGKPKSGIKNWNRYLDEFGSSKVYYDEFPEDIRYIIMNSFSQSDHQSSSGKPKKPRRSWFPHLKSAKSLYISEEDFSIELADNKLIWRVEENNKAVDYARENPVVKALWNSVNGIIWTRGSGGEVVGNNEYNVDGETDAPNNNFVVAMFSSTKDIRTQKYPI